MVSIATDSPAMVFFGLHGLNLYLFNIKYAVVSDLKSIMPTHRSIRLVLDVSSNWVPLHRLPIWLHQSLTVWSIAIPFYFNCGSSYPLTINGSVSIWQNFILQWIYFNHIQGPISVRIIHWIHFDPTKFQNPGYLSTQYMYSYNAILGLFQPQKFPINMICGSLSTLNKSNNSTSNSNSTTQVYRAPLALPGHCPYTSFYE